MKRKKLSFYLYSNRDFKFDSMDQRFHKRIGRGILAKVGTLWLLTQGRKIVMDDKIGIFWGAERILPHNIPARKILTVHDLVWYYYPSTMRSYNFLVHKLLAKRAILDADIIVAVSESTATDVKKVFQVPNEKIIVLHSWS